MKDLNLEDILLEGRGQIYEFDLNSIVGKFKNKVFNNKNKVYNEFAKLLGKQFQGEFGKYLEKHIRKNGEKMDAIGMLLQYFQSPSTSNFEDVYALIGKPMLEFFLKKVFGKVNLKDKAKFKIRNLTPFLKKVSSGNKQMDMFIFRGIADMLNEKEVEKKFKVQLRQILDDKLGDAFNDKDFADFFEELFNSPDETNEGKLNEAGLGKKVSRAFSGNKSKWKVFDLITDVIPNLRKSILRNIKNDIFNMDEKVINKILLSQDRNRWKPITKSITKNVLKHLVKNSRDIYFKENYMSELTDVVQKVFMSSDMVDEISQSMNDFMRLQKASFDKKQKERKLKQQKRKQKVKSGLGKFKRNEPIYKDLLKY